MESGVTMICVEKSFVTECYVNEYLSYRCSSVDDLVFTLPAKRTNVGFTIILWNLALKDAIDVLRRVAMCAANKGFLRFLLFIGAVTNALDGWLCICFDITFGFFSFPLNAGFSRIHQH